MLYRLPAPVVGSLAQNGLYEDKGPSPSAAPGAIPSEREADVECGVAITEEVASGCQWLLRNTVRLLYSSCVSSVF